ncbi:hypothetical protein FRC03_007040, partial [Tulasnella sp. 419]
MRYPTGAGAFVMSNFWWLSSFPALRAADKCTHFLSRRQCGLTYSEMDCLETLKALIKTAEKIKTTFDEVPTANTWLATLIPSERGELSHEILNDLICIRNICYSIYVPHGARLVKDLELVKT